MKVLLHGFALKDSTVAGFSELAGAKNVHVFSPQDDPGRKNYSLDNLAQYDLIAFGQLCYFDRYLKRILDYNTSAPKIYIDTGDDFFIKNIFKHKAIEYYFKRELYNTQPTNAIEWEARYLFGQYLSTPLNGGGYNLSNSWHRLRMPYKISVKGSIKSKKPILPYPISVPSNRSVSWGSRNIDLSFILKLVGQRGRVDMFNYLTNLQKEMPDEKMVISPGNLKRDSFYDMLSHSKASISLRGYGMDTFRYWEIPSFGSLLMSPDIPLLIPNNFKDGESAIFFKSKEELKQKFIKYVVKSDEWKEIAKTGYEHHKKYHIPKERVKRQILEQIDLKP
jgi:hypothetical protein